MELRLPTFRQRVKSAWAILTGRASLWLGVNTLEARWVCAPVGGVYLLIRLDIRFNKITYTAKRSFACPDKNPVDRANAIDLVMKELVYETVARVLLGEKK
jgi:hypothetical protein